MAGATDKILTNEQLEILNRQEWPKNTIHIGLSAGIEGMFWLLEIITATEFSNIKKSVAELAQNCSTPNPFFGPEFLQPATEHLGKSNVDYLCFSEITGEHRELKLFAPVQHRKVGLRRHNALRIWSHPFAPLSTPLVKSSDFDRTIEALIDCIENAKAQSFAAILFDDLPVRSDFSKTIFAAPRLADRLIRFATKTRGSILGREGIEQAVENITGKRKQRLHKAEHHLKTFGELRFHVESSSRDVADALQEHLSLENKGWKSKGGTSILQDENTAHFTKKAVAQLAAKNHCELHSLKLNDHMIASMILLQQNGHYFPWKIAFDEKYSRYSAGNLLLTHVNKQISKDIEFTSLDSLASELNETAKRFWPDPMEISSMVIGLGPKASKTAIQIASDLRTISSAKKAIKKLLGRSL